MSHKNPPSLDETVRFTTQVGARGRLVLPAAVRKRLALNEGDRVVLTLEPDGSMRLVGLREQVRKVRGLFRNVAPDVDMVAELIRERRDEERRETEQP
jgi:AbrB family looped-hinge helix DNA binding protein